MFEKFGNVFGGRPAPKGGPLLREPSSNGSPLRQDAGDRKPVFSKIFRWRLPDGETHDPSTVEVAGSFTHWQKVPLVRDGVLGAWHATMHHLQGNRTHHYVLLVDGKPTFDKTCDGMAVPHGPDEERYQIMTDRGPRVMMLFAQTK